MNIDFLYHHLTEQFYTNIYIYDQKYHIVQTYILRPELTNIFTGLERHLALLCQDVTGPTLYSINHLLSYLIVPIKKQYCLIGPIGVCSNALKQRHIPQLTPSGKTITALYPNKSSELIHIGVLLYNLFAPTPIKEAECFKMNCKSQTIENPMAKTTERLFQLEEYGARHNSYEHEIIEMHAIQTGDAQQLTKLWAEETEGTLGVLSKIPENHAKYLCIINVALSARAAIKGGLPYELAFSLSDSYCQQIDTVTKDSLLELEAIIHNVELTYANLVSQHRAQTRETIHAGSPLIERTKNYIFSHLHCKITVKDVAEVLHAHPNYLNRIFRKNTGITIHDYIISEKIKLAVNMLTYSDYSYIEIANYLGFASQSHLGSSFKKSTGMTLRQYRETYKCQ